jgi:hypothetical protein
VRGATPAAKPDACVLRYGGPPSPLSRLSDVGSLEQIQSEKRTRQLSRAQQGAAINKGKKRKKGILSGHTRIGKRFVPPLMRLPTKVEKLSYVDNILPELIWIGLIYDRIGYVAAARFLENIFHAAMSAGGEDELPRGNPALVSYYEQFTEAQRVTFCAELQARSMLENLRAWLEPLITLYLTFPLRFIGPPEHARTEERLASEMKACVGRYIDKYKTPGIVLNGSLLLAGLVTKKLHFSSDINLPDFNAVISAPDSDEAAHAASFMRAHALSEFGMRAVSVDWANIFWDRGIEISRCDFGEDDVGG